MIIQESEGVRYLCLTLAFLDSQTSAETPEQQWYVKDGDSAIQLAGTTLCLDAGESSEYT